MSRTLLYGLLLVAVVLAIGTTGWRIGVDHTERTWQVKWAERDATEAKVRGDAVQAARDEEQRRYAANREVSADAQATEQRIQIDVGALAAGVGGLRLDTANFVQRASQCPSNPAVTDRGPAATRAALVLSELLDRSVSVNQELAAAYDRVRNSAVTCARLYDSLKPP